MIDRWENLGITGKLDGGIPWRRLLHLWQSFSLWVVFFTLHDGAPRDHGSKKSLVPDLPNRPTSK